jgi:hypothetical protein
MTAWNGYFKRGLSQRIAKFKVTKETGLSISLGLSGNKTVSKWQPMKP